MPSFGDGTVRCRVHPFFFKSVHRPPDARASLSSPARRFPPPFSWNSMKKKRFSPSRGTRASPSSKPGFVLSHTMSFTVFFLPAGWQLPSLLRYRSDRPWFDSQFFFFPRLAACSLPFLASTGTRRCPPPRFRNGPIPFLSRSAGNQSPLLYKLRAPLISPPPLPLFLLRDYFPRR